MIVEAPPRDKLWGVGQNVDEPGVVDKAAWQGTNHFGNVDMKVRDELRIHHSLNDFHMNVERNAYDRK